MTRVITPRGYLNIYDAMRILAEIPNYSAEDDEWRDTGDYLNDASSLDAATRDLRQRLCDGELTAYYQKEAGKVIQVPELIWENDQACLDRASSDEQFRDFRFLHDEGIEIDGIRRRTFISEKELKAFMRGEGEKPSSPLPKTKRRPGRPSGVGGFNDETWLNKMEEVVRQGKSPFQAATDIVSENIKDIERKPGTSDAHVADRLYSKYMKSNRPK